MLAVIGGSGIYDLEETQQGETFEVETPFGRASDPLHMARIGQTDVLFLARHGAGHVYSPSSVPYRANVFALKELGATRLLSLSAVGSLREELPPRSLVTPDQIIDRTIRHERSFFESGVVAHVGMADPFCARLRAATGEAAELAGRPVRRDGTYVCIEGPQFSTRAESNLYRSWGATVIGMTAMPEARLAREAGLCYAMLAMVTDYDVWHDAEEDVSVEVVNSHLRANSESARAIIRQLVAGGLPERTCACGLALEHAIMTAPELIPIEARTWIRMLADK
ncbi:MAG TPA: S-methyl-5'-thioadenosine phosphorylase [Thermomicrobiales bacterium]|jgi:5'-methylthioadenosine phosphorylase|nr:S-methyl-5'-thioadenosine phosphorylase [Thermomicrobiales bacterium]